MKLLWIGTVKKDLALFVWKCQILKAIIGLSLWMNKEKISKWWWVFFSFLHLQTFLKIKCNLVLTLLLLKGDYSPKFHYDYCPSIPIIWKHQQQCLFFLCPSSRGHENNDIINKCQKCKRRLRKVHNRSRFCL